jgi:hypothetical protein
MESVRTLDSYVGEALKRERHGLIRPLWADMSCEQKGPWTARARFLIGILNDMGCKLESPTHPRSE